MASELENELEGSKDYRDAFVAAHVRDGIAFQVKAMRNARTWDQKTLAERLGNVKLQPMISRYENPDYGRMSVSTLIELANAFDVALNVSFVPFSELVKRDEDLLNTPLEVPSFGKEPKAPRKLKSYTEVLKSVYGYCGPAAKHDPAVLLQSVKPGESQLSSPDNVQFGEIKTIEGGNQYGC